MTKSRTTKRALLMSALALLLCFSMLIGTTYAWFTDSVTSGNNIIKSGNLDIDLQYHNGTEWKTVQDATDLFKDSLWEPGHTQVVYLKLSNEGSLALKYNLGVNVASETGSTNKDGDFFLLSDYIEYGVLENVMPDNGKTREQLVEMVGVGTSLNAPYTKTGSMAADAADLYLALVVFMPESVDNEANHKTGVPAPVINLGIKAMATQFTAEEDSFDKFYDENAGWLGEIDTTWYDAAKDEFTLTSAAQLAGLAKLVNEGNSFEKKTVIIGKSIDLNNTPWTPIGTMTSPFKGTLRGADGVKIYNLNVSGNNAIGLVGASYVPAEIDNIDVIGATVSGNHWVGTVLGHGYLATNCLKNCDVENATVLCAPELTAEGWDNGDKAGAVAGWTACGHILNNSATNCSVTAFRDFGGIVGYAADESGSTDPEVKGNKVSGVSLSFYTVTGKVVDNNVNGNAAMILGRNGGVVVVDENTPVSVEEGTKATVIYTAEELRAFAAEVNAGKDFAGKTVYLGADIDLQNREWTPIGTSSNPFQGTFDGNGKAIKNLVITGRKSTVGLFGHTTNGKICNLTVENAQVSGRLNVGVVAGSPYTSKYENITVKGLIRVEGMAYVGGVGGKNAYANWNNITVNASEGSYVKADSVENGIAYRTYVGGVIGFMGEGGHKVSNVTSNLDVYGSTCDVGGIVGIAHYGNTLENVTCTGNVEIFNASEAADAEEMGGIAGVWNNGGADVKLNNCKFTGTLKANVAADLSDNTLTGIAYSETGTGKLIIDGVEQKKAATVADLQSALDGAEAGVPVQITLDQDMEAGEITVPANTEVEILLNNKKLTVEKLEAKDAAISVKGGTIVHDESTYPAVSVDTNGKLVMENVTIVCEEPCNVYKNGDLEVAAEYVALQVFGGECVLNNCNVVAKVDKIRYANSVYGIALHGGTLTMNGGSVTVESVGSSSNLDFQAAFAGWQNGKKEINLNNVTVNAKNLLDVGGGNVTVNTTDAQGSWDGKCVSNGGTYTINYK